jgi:hypothetical protein
MHSRPSKSWLPTPAQNSVGTVEVRTKSWTTWRVVHVFIRGSASSRAALWLGYMIPELLLPFVIALTHRAALRR